MQITEIKRKGKSEQYYVYTDNEFYGLLQAEYIYKSKLKTGQEIKKEELDKIKEQSDKLSCTNHALTYVSKMLKSEKQVRQYLCKYNYSQQAINESIEKLKSYGYINDEYFANLIIQGNKDKKGKNYIKKQLIQKGIGKDSIGELLENLEDNPHACQDQAKKWLKGKELPLDANNKAKLYRFLIGKGFEFETAKRVLQKLNVGEEDDWNWFNRKSKNRWGTKN